MRNPKERLKANREKAANRSKHAGIHQEMDSLGKEGLAKDEENLINGSNQSYGGIDNLSLN